MSSLGPKLLVSRQSCPYIHGKTETLFHIAYPERKQANKSVVSDLFDQFWEDFASVGYRRQGRHIYRPECNQCKACVATRVIVDEFKWKRRFKRVLNINKDIEIRPCDQYEFSQQELFELYSKYITARHSDGPMYPPSIETMRNILYLEHDRSDFHLVGLLNGKVVFLAQTDALVDGLSANYTMFDPDLPDRSLGIFAILTQIQYAQRLELPYLYLGFSLKAVQNMRYKLEFHPQQHFIDEEWQLSEE